jgi:hypothetical protein
MVIEPRRLEPEKRLIIAEVLRQGAIAENVAIMSSHAKDGNPRAAGLERHNGPFLPRKRLSGTEEFYDFAFAPLQLIAQLGRQHAGWSIAAQPIAVGPDLNVAAAQLCEDGCHAHNAISSR